MNDRPTPPDAELFPASFLRLLSLVPAAVPRLHAGVADGRRAVRGEGGRFLFRGHRSYRPGDDLSRVDWNVAARLGRIVVRQLDAERDVKTEVWLDGSASMGTGGARIVGVRLAALSVAIAVAADGRVRLGCLREGRAQTLIDVRDRSRMHAVLELLARDAPRSRADMAKALPRVLDGMDRRSRFLLISDLLTRTDPGVLHALAGRGVRGALLHVRIPEVVRPEVRADTTYIDAETGERRTVRLDEAAAARVAERAARHADLWARHARGVGLRHLPFAPGEPDEAWLRRLILEVP